MILPRPDFLARCSLFVSDCNLAGRSRWTSASQSRPMFPHRSSCRLTRLLRSGADSSPHVARVLVLADLHEELVQGFAIAQRRR